MAGQIVGQIERGLVVFVGVGQTDTEESAAALAHKVTSLRIFEDEAERMNRSVLDVGGAILAVSQFTLFGDVRRGRRPSFTAAMEPARAKELFEHFCASCEAQGVTTETGTFRAHMSVELCNDGPVTILIDTERAF